MLPAQDWELSGAIRIFAGTEAWKICFVIRKCNLIYWKVQHNFWLLKGQWSMQPAAGSLRKTKKSLKNFLLHMLIFHCQTAEIYYPKKDRPYLTVWDFSEPCRASMIWTAFL